MSKKKFTHVSPDGLPRMVDVSEKKITKRTARARAIIRPGALIIDQIQGDELITKKGPVFQTAIIAGVMGAKKTSELIPFCHPIALEDCQVTIRVSGLQIIIDTESVTTGKTGVEMEALTAASTA